MVIDVTCVGVLPALVQKPHKPTSLAAVLVLRSSDDTVERTYYQLYRSHFRNLGQTVRQVVCRH